MHATWHAVSVFVHHLAAVRWHWLGLAVACQLLKLGAVSRAWRNIVKAAYRDRRVKKRTFRTLWQVRINAASRAAGMTYSRFMEGLKAAQVALDRKILADLAATDAAAFSELIRIAQDALKTKSAKALAGR